MIPRPRVTFAPSIGWATALPSCPPSTRCPPRPAPDPAAPGPARQRAIGAGRVFVLDPRDQLLVTLVWLRRYPTPAGLGWLFGVSDSTTVRIVARILPLLERLGHETMRFPDPGKHHRRSFDDLLAE